MKQPLTAHKYRQMGIHAWLLILIGFMGLILAFSCSPRYGCASSSGKNYKVGYHPKK